MVCWSLIAVLVDDFALLDVQLLVEFILELLHDAVDSRNGWTRLSHT